MTGDCSLKIFAEEEFLKLTLNRILTEINKHGGARLITIGIAEDWKYSVRRLLSRGYEPGELREYSKVADPEEFERYLKYAMKYNNHPHAENIARVNDYEYLVEHRRFLEKETGCEVVFRTGEKRAIPGKPFINGWWCDET